MNAPRLTESTSTGFVQKLPALLRILGACALVVAMYGFLVRGWQSSNDVQRYLMLLGHTGLLAATGLASGYWLREGKGARLLVTMALVSVPVNFAILGAFIMSQTHGVDPVQYPHYVRWSVDSWITAIVTTIGAIVVLLPVTRVGFTVLARSMSRTLTALFFSSNLALLLPVREPLNIALLVGLLTGAVIWSARNAARDEPAAKTPEGFVALGLQFLPIGVFFGRSLWLYSDDLFLATLAAATLFVALRQVSLYLRWDSTLRHWLDAASLAPALWLLPLSGRAVYATGMVPSDLSIPFGTTLAAALVYDIACRTQRHAARYRRLAVLVLWTGMLGNLALSSSDLAALACFCVGAAVMVHGYSTRQVGLLSGGIVLVVAGVIHQAIELVRHFDFGGWVGLAILGVFAILVGSALESQSAAWRLRFRAWRDQLKTWEK